LSSTRLGKDESVPVWMWLCPGMSPEPTVLGFVKPVLAGGRAYVAQAQFQGPAPAGRVPIIAESSQDRAMEFIRLFDACQRLSDPGCVPLDAVMGKHGEAAMSASEQLEAARIGARGLAMHYQDQLAWHASDHVRERKLFRPRRGEGGFLSIAGAGRSGQTYFVATRKGAIEDVLQVDTGADGQVTGTTRIKSLPVELLPRWRARQTALASPDLKLCSPNPNTLVLPAEDGAGWWVYVMSASTVLEQMFLGGHNRLRVSADGERIEALEHSARGCLAVDAGTLRALGRNEGFYLNHLVSPLPWETDVMQSLTFAVPFTRVTDTGIWRIEGDRLHKFAMQAATPAP
jgi:hypothetical protein